MGELFGGSVEVDGGVAVDAGDGGVEVGEVLLGGDAGGGGGDEGGGVGGGAFGARLGVGAGGDGAEFGVVDEVGDGGLVVTQIPP